MWFVLSKDWSQTFQNNTHLSKGLIWHILFQQNWIYYFKNVLFVSPVHAMILEKHRICQVPDNIFYLICSETEKKTNLLKNNCDTYGILDALV